MPTNSGECAKLICAVLHVFRREEGLMQFSYFPSGYHISGIILWPFLLCVWSSGTSIGQLCK